MKTHSEKQSGLAAQTRQEIITEKSNSGLPVWIRPPKSGTEFYSGLSRAKLYELATDGLIQSRSLRKAGQLKGTRLFHLQSILDFIGGAK